MMHPPNHVLLIEDNPGDADLVRLRLVESKSEMDVACVHRLADGLQSLAHEPPSVVLLDLNLPDSRGAETFRKVLSQAPGIPVVVLSGQDDEELAVKAVHQGVQDYLVKGAFDGKQLARAMRYAVERQALLTSLDMSRKQQLQFKDQFLSHVSHELRTPLASIYQFATILLDGLAGPVSTEQSEHLDTIVRSATQLRAMIGDLLEASRTESGKMRIERRCISIEGLARQSVSMLRPMADEKGVRLELSWDQEIGLVQADAERVLQVLTNLIHNAIKFTPAEGSIVVKGSLTETDPDFVYISVSDTGIGISAEARPLIFERMYQAPDSIDDSRKGLGLGLYIAKEIVRQHDGRIWASGDPGKGSVFTFTLPLFSLAEHIAPVITYGGKLRDFISLIQVEMLPRAPSRAVNWGEIRANCREVLKGSILPERDVILPPIGPRNADKVFLIVASADIHGTEVLIRRIKEQFVLSLDLQANVDLKLSATLVPRSSESEGLALVKLVESVADSITEHVMHDTTSLN